MTGLEAPPTLDMLSAINVRSSVEQVGAISFSDSMLNQVRCVLSQSVLCTGQQTGWLSR